MFPARFRYESPTSVEEVCALLKEGAGEAKVLAGGQSLIPMLKLRFASPELLVDINSLPGLDYETVDADGTLHIGALRRHRTLERSEILKSSQPTLAATAPLIADPVVRSRGTLVGSLSHADPQGDWAAAVTSLGGSVVAQSANGRRVIAIDDYVVGPFQNALSYGEFAVEAIIPAPEGTRLGGYIKLERRVGDFATAGAAVNVEIARGSVAKAGIALTGVGGKTINAKDAAAALVGQPLTASTISRAAALAAEVAEPKTDHRGSADYKRHLINTFVTRILTNLTAEGRAA